MARRAKTLRPESVDEDPAPIAELKKIRRGMAT